MTVLVTGATGTVGREIVRQLRATDTRVRALSRNPGSATGPEGVDVVYGDLSDPSSLAPVLDGVVAMHLITFAGDGSTPLPNPEKIVEFATEAGVQRFTVLSGYHTGPVEEAVRNSGAEWTVLEPVEFMSNMLWEWAPAISEAKAIRVPFPWIRSAQVHPADIAAVAVEILRNGGHHGKALPLTGPHAFKPLEALEIIGEVTGQQIDAVELDETQSREQLLTEGFSATDIDEIVGMYGSQDESDTQISRAISNVTGRPARTLKQWVTENADAFRGRPAD